jgi:putative ABC transport system permease protein
MNPVFFRISLSYFRRHVLQTGLLILGIALGVAVVIAIDLANTGAERAFKLSTQTLTGKATHRLIGDSRQGISEKLYVRLRLEKPEIVAAPVVTGFVKRDQKSKQRVRLLGLDPFVEGPFRAYLPLNPGQNLDAFQTLLTGQASALISRQFQASLPPQTSALNIYMGNKKFDLKITGILDPAGAWEKEGLRQVILTDPGTAQKILGQKGYLSHIDLILNAAQIKSLKAWLPPNCTLIETESQASTLQSMTKAFSLNLSALSLLALLVGMFLVYNTVTFSVVQRRPLWGSLRSLGVTREEIFGLILFETSVLAGLGLLLGSALGIWMGQMALQLVLNTIQDLYFKLEVSQFTLSPLSLIKGAIAGGFAALLASALPAWEAAQTAPAGALKRSVLEARIQALLPGLMLTGSLVSILGIGLMLWPGESLLVSFSGFFAAVIGSALIVPSMISPLMKILSHILGKHSLLMRLAPRNVARALSRTSVSITALMVAVSVVVSVNIMIGSFRSTLIDWLDRTLAADIFITQAERENSQEIPLSLRKEVQQWPGIKTVESARQRRLEQTGYGAVNLFVLSRDTASHRPYVWKEGPANKIWAGLESGGVLVSQPFAYRHKIASRPGQKLELQTQQGKQTFQILGIYHDYLTGPGSVMMADTVYRRYWNDPLIDSLAVLVEQPEQLEQTLQMLEKKLSSRYAVSIQSNRNLREGALTIFDRTFAITGALRLLAMLVAFMGIFSTLLALQLERTREFGLLRALGLTRWQLSRLILLESTMMGLAAGLFALPLGTGLSWALIYVINLRSFGWLLNFEPNPNYYIQALAMSLGAAVLAGLWPAWKLAQLSPAEALKYE